jgi:hypothetical protein
MQTLSQLPEEGQKAIARSLGYDGKKEGFPAYLMSNRKIAERYSSLENAYRKKQQKSNMAEGGLMMDRFAQKQQQDMIGGYVPPPKQSFAEGGATTTPINNTGTTTTGGATIPAGKIGDNKEVGGPKTLPEIIPDYRINPPYTPLPTPQPVYEPGVTATPSVAAPVQNFTGTTVPVMDTNEFLEDGVTVNPNYNQQAVGEDGEGLTQEIAPNIGQVSAQMLTNPGLPVGAEIQTVTTTPNSNQLIDSGTGQLTGNVAVDTAQATTSTADAVTAQDANVMTTDGTKADVDTVVGGMSGATGTVSDESQVTAAQQTTSAVSDLKAAEGEANIMENPVTRQIQEGELITGAANAATASAYAEQIQAATATPSDKATVAGQLATLTDDFDVSNPPPWAAGSLRAVQAQMAARGLGASSMAGQAMIQGALESALPIAQADAATNASFETQNLSNRQARAMLAAQQRATFIGQEFDQEFQSRVKNSARIGDIANMNFTAEQNIALENSRAVNTMNLANLGNKQAMVMAEASALANLDIANLSNRQQSAVQNAQSFLQMDMADLANQQQVDMFAGQQQVQALFTDQAAKNAAAQFNATSENQTDQFFASLGQQTNQFNATQLNAQSQFNAGQENTLERFNAEIGNQRDQFNAQNQTVIAQSNANWRRQIASEATANTNRANELNAQNVLGVSQTAYNNLWQHYGDTMEWAWTSAENERSRVIELAMAQLQADSSADIQKMKDDTASSTAFGGLIGKFVTGAVFGGGGGLF